MSYLYTNLINTTNCSITSGTISSLNTASTLLVTSITSGNINITSQINNSNKQYMTAYVSTSQSLSTGVSAIVTNWTVISSNGITSNSGTFTVALPGLYFVGLNIGFAFNTNGNRASWCWKNGSTTDTERYGNTTWASTVGERTDIPLAFIIFMNTGDTIQPWAWQNCGSTISINGDTTFQMTKFFMYKIC
jgi:hypothetical protein